jgi:hypothetical protein
VKQAVMKGLLLPGRQKRCTALTWVYWEASCTHKMGWKILNALGKLHSFPIYDFALSWVSFFWGNMSSIGKID